MLQFANWTRGSSSSSRRACAEVAPRSEPTSTAIFPFYDIPKVKKEALRNVGQWVLPPPGLAGEQKNAVNGPEREERGRREDEGPVTRRNRCIERGSPLKHIRLSRPSLPSIRSAPFFREKDSREADSRLWPRVFREQKLPSSVDSISTQQRAFQDA